MLDRPTPDPEISPLADDPQFMDQLVELGLPPDVVTREGFRRFIASDPTWQDWLSEILKHDPRDVAEQARAAGPEAFRAPPPPADEPEQPGFAEGGLIGPMPREAGDLEDPRFGRGWREGGEGPELPDWFPNAYLGAQGLTGPSRGNVVYGGINGRIPLGDNAELRGGYSASEADLRHSGGRSRSVRDEVTLGGRLGPVSGDISRSRSPYSNGYDTPAGRRIFGNLNVDLHRDALGGQLSAEYERNRQGHDQGMLRYRLGFADGGFAAAPEAEVEQAGGLMEPVPPGALPEEVADDVDAKLSVGELVIPADVVRWHGIKTFEAMRAEAKDGLGAMEGEGRIQAPGGLMAPPELPDEPEPMEGPPPPFEEGGAAEPLGFAAGGLVSAPYTDQFGRGTFAPTTPLPQPMDTFSSLGITPVTANNPVPAAPAPLPPVAPAPPAPTDNSSWIAPAAAAAAVGTAAAGSPSPTPSSPPPASSGSGGSIWDSLGNAAINQGGKGLLGYIAANAVTAPGAELAGTAGGGFGNVIQDAGGVVDGIVSGIGTAGGDLAGWAGGQLDKLANFGSLAVSNPGAALGQAASSLASSAVSAGASMVGGYLGNLVGYELFGPGDAEQRPVSTGLGTAGGAMLGAQIGSVIPGIGTVIGGAIGAFLGAILGSSMAGRPDYPYSWVAPVVNATETGAQLNMSEAGSMNHASANPAARLGSALDGYLTDRAAEEGYVLNNEQVNRPTFFTGTYKNQLFYRPAWDDPDGWAVRPQEASAYTGDPRALAELAWNDSVAHGLFVKPDQQRDWGEVRAALDAKAAADQGVTHYSESEAGSSYTHEDAKPWHAQRVETAQERQKAAEQAAWLESYKASNPYWDAPAAGSEGG